MSWNNHITCTHCGYEDEEVVDYPRNLERDGDTAGWDCPACGMVHTVTLSVSFEFHTEPGYHREVGVGFFGR